MTRFDINNFFLLSKYQHQGALYQLYTCTGKLLISRLLISKLDHLIPVNSSFLYYSAKRLVVLSRYASKYKLNVRSSLAHDMVYVYTGRVKEYELFSYTILGLILVG